MPPRNSSSTSEPRRLARGASLLACTAAIAFGWLVILPLLARTRPVRAMITRNESLGIDPSAKFYSELPLAPTIMPSLRRLHDQQPRLPLRNAPEPRD